MFASNEDVEKTLNNLNSRKVYIFEDVDGYHICDVDGPLDARGKAYPTKAEALRAALYEGYTHAEGSGTYRNGKIPEDV
jgi:hypothetical protein